MAVSGNQTILPNGSGGGGTGDMLSTNNLSELTNTVTARSNLGLSTVENTALSTWTGSTSVTTLGTVATGTWQGTAIAVSKGGTGTTSSALNPSVAVLRDANSNALVNNLIESYTTTATASGTTTLTVASTYNQYFTGTLAQNCKMPDVTTLVLGQSWCITNNSTNTVTIQSSGLNTIVALATLQSAIVTCIAITGTSNTSWDYCIIQKSYSAGGGDMVLASVQTVSGAKTFNDTKLLLNNVAGTFTGQFTNTNTANRTYTLQDSSDTLVGRATTDTLTNKLISGGTNTLSAIANASLTNSSVTIGSTSVSLGATASTITGLTLTTPVINGLATGTGIASASTVSTIATRDANGNLSNVNLLLIIDGKFEVNLFIFE
jgi:hypothetical protein